MMRPLFPALAALSLFAGLPAPAVGPDDGYDRKLTIQFQNVGLFEALEQTFRGTRLQYVVEPTVPDVPITLTVRDISVEAVLRLMVRQAAVAAPGLTLSRDGEVTLIKMRSRFFPPQAAPLPPPVAERRVTVSFKEVPLRSALDALFMGSGQQYLVEPDVPNVKVSLHLRDLPLAQAFRLLLRQAAAVSPGLTSLRSGDTVVIRQGTPRLVQGEAGGPPGTGRTLVAGDTKPPWQKISLRYADVAALTRALGGSLYGEGSGRPAPAPADDLLIEEGAIRVRPLPRNTRTRTADADLPPPNDPRLLNPGSGAPGALTVPEGVERVVGVRSQNALLVLGTEAGVRQLREVVRLVDVAPRQFRVRLSAGSVAGEGQVVNGATLSVTDMSGPDRLAVSVTPRVSGEGRVEVSVEGMVRIAGSDRPIQSRIRVRSGTATPFLTLGEGRRAQKVWLRVTEVPQGS